MVILHYRRRALMGYRSIHATLPKIGFMGFIISYFFFTTIFKIFLLDCFFSLILDRHYYTFIRAHYILSTSVCFCFFNIYIYILCIIVTYIYIGTVAVAKYNIISICLLFRKRSRMDLPETIILCSKKKDGKYK